jgi:hypothetical protein
MCSNMTWGVDTYYVERANGRFEYWTYCEGRKVYVSKATVDKAVKQGDKLVHVG